MEPRTLRECRIALGQSQSSFAAMLGVSPESYRTWDAGRRATPPKILARARALAHHQLDGRKLCGYALTLTREEDERLPRARARHRMTLEDPPR